MQNAPEKSQGRFSLGNESEAAAQDGCQANVDLDLCACCDSWNLAASLIC